MNKNHKYKLYIDGAFRDATDGATFVSINPATEEPWAVMPAAGEADVDRAVDTASRALWDGPWAALTATRRGEMLHRLGDLLVERAGEFAEIETRDTGKIIRETAGQTAYMAGFYHYYGGLADKLEGSTLPIDKPDMMVLTLREPIGVVAGVVPWNSQLFLSATKLAPALAAGNTIVLKASEEAPAPLLKFAELVDEAGLPPGVVNIVTGFGEPCGRRLTSHPDVARELGRLLGQAGFDVVQRGVHTIWNQKFDSENFGWHVARAMSVYAAKQGVIAKDKGKAWIAGFRDLDADNAFFFSMNRYLFLAEKHSADTLDI